MYNKFLDNINSNKTKSIFKEIYRANNKRELINSITKLIKNFDKNYARYRGGNEYSFDDINKNNKITLYTNGGYNDGDIVLSTLFAPSTIWDITEFLVDYLNDKEVFKKTSSIWKRLKILKDKNEKQLQKEYDYMSDESGFKRRPEQEFANILSEAFILSIPRDKLKFVDIKIGKITESSTRDRSKINKHIVKIESALFKSELFTYCNRSASIYKGKAKSFEIANKKLKFLSSRKKLNNNKRKIAKYEIKKIMKNPNLYKQKIEKELKRKNKNKSRHGGFI